jgi:hypothetical protein
MADDELAVRKARVEQAMSDAYMGKALVHRFDDHVPKVVDVPICAKTWWEDGEQYECLMDKGHREALLGKHGLRGMVQRID